MKAGRRIALFLLGTVLVFGSPFVYAQQPAEQPLIEFRTAGVSAELKKNPRDPEVYLLKIPSNSRIDIIYPQILRKVDPGQWYEVRYLDETGWLRGNEIETVVLDSGL